MSCTEFFLLVNLAAIWPLFIVTMIFYTRLVTRYGKLVVEYAQLLEWLDKKAKT